MKLIRENIQMFQCPICHQSVRVKESNSLLCPKNHTFDVAKQGYVHMTNTTLKSRYNKDLFSARHFIITQTNLFQPLHKTISEMITKHVPGVDKPMILFDAGCGEGSHLQKIIDRSDATSIIGVGLDIAKEGIQHAAKNYELPIWLVGDLANAPIADKSCHVILNILSPANYNEFIRMLHSNGIVIKVIPRSNYLIELRNELFEDRNKKQYDNEKIVSLFKQHFHLKEYKSLTEVTRLNEEEMNHLMKMTPLAWEATKEKIDALRTKGEMDITIDLDILIGKIAK